MAEIPEGQEVARLRYVVDPNYRPRGGQRYSLRIAGDLDVRSTAPVFGEASRMGLLAAADQVRSPVTRTGPVVLDPMMSVDEAQAALEGLSAAVEAVSAEATSADRATAEKLSEQSITERREAYVAAHDLQEASRALQAAASALRGDPAPRS
jgi:hypothetical protein